MAETLSYQPEVQTETMPDNLTPEEQENLAVGEKLQGDQEQLLAGKYKNAEELEKAYVELQKKLGDNVEQEETETASAAEEQPEDKPNLSDGATLITSATDEFYDNNGQLSEDTLNKFSSMSSKDLVKAYMEVQQLPEYQPREASAIDLSESDINQVQNAVGGEQAYGNMLNWARTNLSQEEISAFDSIVNTGSVGAIRIAAAGLKAQYDAANGVEGTMYTGKAPKSNGDVFRSQQELVRAMSDPRYDNDPAYRQDIIEKLDRSDLEF
jgi:hypothetical protein